MCTKVRSRKKSLEDENVNLPSKIKVRLQNTKLSPHICVLILFKWFLIQYFSKMYSNLRIASKLHTNLGANVNDLIQIDRKYE